MLFLKKYKVDESIFPISLIIDVVFGFYSKPSRHNSDVDTCKTAILKLNYWRSTFLVEQTSVFGSMLLCRKDNNTFNTESFHCQMANEELHGYSMEQHTCFNNFIDRAFFSNTIGFFFCNHLKIMNL